MAAYARADEEYAFGEVESLPGVKDLSVATKLMQAVPV